MAKKPSAKPSTASKNGRDPEHNATDKSSARQGSSALPEMAPGTPSATATESAPGLVTPADSAAVSASSHREKTRAVTEPKIALSSAMDTAAQPTAPLASCAAGNEAVAAVEQPTAAPSETPAAPPLPAEGETEPSPAMQSSSITPAEPSGAPPEPPATEPPILASQPETAPEPAVLEPIVSPPPIVYQRPSMFIIHVTPEMAPVAKVGGLADVVFGLTRELAIRGNHVEIILPKYDNLRYDHIYELHRVYDDLWVPWYEGAIHCTVYFGFVHGRKCFFIESHSQDNFFNRGSIYGFRDDIWRYAFFSRAAIEFMWKSGKHPEIIHCHDWQTALVPVFLYEIYQQMGMTHPRVCLTIHNFQHQGVTGGELLRATGLHRPEHFFDYHRLRDNRHPHALNLLKGGIVYSNFVCTVSPRHAFEAKDQGQGFGLEPTLHTHHVKYGGVINGVDYDVWNPEIDRLIPVRYSVDHIDAKYDNKRALRHRLLLADNEKPIVAFIGRLDPQKGLELVRHAIFYSLGQGAQFVLLGSSPDHRINNEFWGLKRLLNDNPDCHLEIGFDEDLSHLIYAGADLMLVPSRFEPCGLTQLIAMRYGTIPVVRSVGGLADTVFDKDYSHRPLHERNGYCFEHYDAPGLESALGRAIACYYQYPEHFRELIKNAMRADYSWNRPGADYLNIYDYIRDR